MSFVRSRIVIGLAAALIGAGAAIGIEFATQWSPVGSSSTTVTSPCPSVTHLTGSRIEICVEPAPTSPAPTSDAEQFLSAALAALIGSLLGVVTFVIGQVSVSSRERRAGQVAVTVVRKELQANRSAINSALSPTLPGTSPTTERLTVSVFPLVRMQLADRLSYELFVKTALMYERFDGLGTADLRGIAPQTFGTAER